MMLIKFSWSGEGEGGCTQAWFYNKGFPFLQENKTIY